MRERAGFLAHPIESIRILPQRLHLIEQALPVHLPIEDQPRGLRTLEGFRIV